MPDNRKPLIYGAFPVCRNYTVRAHIRNTDGGAEHPRTFALQPDGACIQQGHRAVLSGDDKGRHRGIGGETESAVAEFSRYTAFAQKFSALQMKMHVFCEVFRRMDKSSLHLGKL